MGLKRGGQVRLIEAALAGITAILLLASISRLIPLLSTKTARPLLEEEAAAILEALSARGVLCTTVYSRYDGAVDGEALKMAVEGLIPLGRGYKIAVVRASDLAELFVIVGSGFNPYSSASRHIVLSGCNGYFEPRIVILSISGD